MVSNIEKLKRKTIQNKVETIDIICKLPYKIYIFDLSYDIDSTIIVDKMIEFRKKYPKSMAEYNKNQTNIRSWHSDYYTHKIDNFLNPLIELQEKKLKKILTGYDVKLKEIWCNMYENNDYAHRHQHSYYGFSSVYFPYVEEYPTPIIFDSNIENDKLVPIIPKTNMLICFPGVMYHRVPKIKESKRYSIAANYNICALENKMRDPLTFQKNS